MLELNKIYNEDCLETMRKIDPGSVHLIVTSPPYNVGIKYDTHDDLMPFEEYMAWLKTVWTACKRILVKGGRIAINVGGLYRSPFLPLHSHITVQMIELGYLMRGVIYWHKGDGTAATTAWGSWQSPSNPILTDSTETILIFCKDDFKLHSDNTESTMSKKEFLQNVKSLWRIPPEYDRSHPAPFPVELPKRLINFYTYKGDVVYDPFMGSGTTAEAADILGRKYIGSEISPKYYKMIKTRTAQTHF